MIPRLIMKVQCDITNGSKVQFVSCGKFFLNFRLEHYNSAA